MDALHGKSQFFFLDLSSRTLTNWNAEHGLIPRTPKKLHKKETIFPVENLMGSPYTRMCKSDCGPA